jgi:hypothetical protein
VNPLATGVLLVLLCSTNAISADDPVAPADGMTVVVHVRNGTTNTEAEAGLPVALLVVHGDEHVMLEGRTDAGGVASIVVPASLLGSKVPRVAASATYMGYQRFGQPFWLFPSGSRHVRTGVTVYRPMRPIRLPTWSVIALAVLFALAVALVAIRRSDGHLSP